MLVTKRVYQKLAPKFFGPFQILDRIGPVAYKLALPPTLKIHPVFHVSLLKKAIAGAAEASFPDGLDLALEDIPVPHLVPESRQIREKGELVEQWLVQWQGQNEEEATWENADMVRGQFPESSLEVKTFSEEGSSDANPDTFLYGMDRPKKKNTPDREREKEESLLTLRLISSFTPAAASVLQASTVAAYLCPPFSPDKTSNPAAVLHPPRRFAVQSRPLSFVLKCVFRSM
ncbi:hypothetical protein LXL04_015892 [Taraxacum kok-saghyz]